MQPSVKSTVELTPSPDLDSERFQQLWMQLPDNQNITKPLKDVGYSTNDIEQAVLQHKIFCMASG